MGCASSTDPRRTKAYELRFRFCASLIMVAKPIPQPQLVACRPVFWYGEANRMADFDSGDGAVLQAV